MASESSIGQQVDLAEANRKYWDAHAKVVFKETWVLHLAEQITDSLQTNLGPDLTAMREEQGGSAGGPIKLLDYACGNGVVSHALAAQVDCTRGIDVSQTMVDEYNRVASDAGFPAKRMVAGRGDIAAADLDPSAAASAAGEDVKEWTDFHAAIMSMALHHVSDPQLVVSRLVERLRPGGVIAILDWEPHAESDAAHAHSHAHKHEHGHAHGHEHEHKHEGSVAADTMSARPSFDAEYMRALFVRAGCDADSVAFLPYHDTTHLPESVTKTPGGIYKRFFLAKARKGGL